LVKVLILFATGWMHGNCYGQEVYLDIKGTDSISDRKIDSLGYKKTFQNLLSLNQELDSLSIRFQRLGYIENQIGRISKIKPDRIYCGYASAQYSPQSISRL